MLRHGLFGLIMAGLLLLGPVPRASATDGHFLHGVGAINSAMGGAGIATPESLLGTFNLNPAGLVAFDRLRNPMPIPGTSVTNSMKEDSVLLQFSFVNEGDI